MRTFGLSSEVCRPPPLAAKVFGSSDQSAAD